MDGETLQADVEASVATELDRLGSPKLLLALTGADLEVRSVLVAVAASERAARDTFEQWAADEADPEVRSVFEAWAGREADHLEAVTAELDGEVPESAPDPLHEHLRELSDTTARVAAGLLGRGLVADRTHLQVINFFVNEADERRADLLREFREETAEGPDQAVALLQERCEDDHDWERAREAAVAAVQVAYESYASDVEALGLDPRPIC